MKVEVLFFAQIKEALGCDHLWVDAVEGTRAGELVSDLLEQNGISHFQSVPLLYAVNEQFVQEDTVLQEKDTLALMIPVSGGA